MTLEKGTLTIRAEQETIAECDSDDPETEGTDDSSTDGRRYFLRERRSGSVARSLLIGDAWDADTVNGTLENGVLSLTIAKSVEAQPRTVEISYGDAASSRGLDLGSPAGPRRSGGRFA